jgi:hypothetical protein
MYIHIYEYTNSYASIFVFVFKFLIIIILFFEKNSIHFYMFYRLIYSYFFIFMFIHQSLYLFYLKKIIIEIMNINFFNKLQYGGNKDYLT